jgi:hypothetical protein
MARSISGAVARRVGHVKLSLIHSLARLLLDLNFVGKGGKASPSWRQCLHFCGEGQNQHLV